MKPILGDAAARFLLDTGLLGEVNRVILHPRGLALSVGDNELDGDAREVRFHSVLDYRDDPGGISFDDDTAKEIEAKLSKFDADEAERRNSPREESHRSISL